jgi:hypothetical protein
MNDIIRSDQLIECACSCVAGAECVRKNPFYAACLSPSEKTKRIGQGWDGTVLKCGDKVGAF